MGQDCDIDVFFHRLPEALSSRFASLSCLTVRGDPEAIAFDVMHPEWASMRIVQSGTPALASFVSEKPWEMPVFTGCGPNCSAIRFGFYDVRIWTVVARPLGWAQHSDVAANAITDQLLDGMTHPAFARFRGLPEVIRNGDAGLEATAQRIEDFLAQMKPLTVPARAHIDALHQSLRDPEVGNVDALANAVGVSRRTLERLARRYFGYSPKLLLRRQRFLRSLASFMLAERDNWSKAIDRHYFDQAHFVRDFKRFMGMTPSEYAEMPHPVMDHVMAQRMADLGAAPRLHEANMPT